MMLILFGKPGVGKNFVGDILQDKFGFYFYDLDKYISPELSVKIKKGEVVSERDRDMFYVVALKKIIKIKKKHPRLAIAQAFLKNKHRFIFKEAFPDSILVWVECSEDIRQNRLDERRHIINKKYDVKLQKLWQDPPDNVTVIYNNAGEMNIIKQLKSIFKNAKIKYKTKS